MNQLRAGGTGPLNNRVIVPPPPASLSPSLPPPHTHTHTHTPTYHLSLSLSVSVSLSLPVYLSVCLFVCVCLSVCLSLCLCHYFFLSVCLSVCLSLCVSICLSVRLFPDSLLFVCLFVCQSARPFFLSASVSKSLLASLSFRFCLFPCLPACLYKRSACPSLSDCHRPRVSCLSIILSSFVPVCLLAYAYPPVYMSISFSLPPSFCL